MTPENALYDLLLSLFSADELRRWLHYDRHRRVVADELPEAPVSKSALITATIDALDRHRLLDTRFFADLRALREHRADEIDHVEVLWMNRPAPPRSPATQPSAQPQPQPSIVNYNQSGGINAPGGTFNGPVIQGNNNEVHHHNRGPSSDDSRKKQ